MYHSSHLVDNGTLPLLQPQSALDASSQRYRQTYRTADLDSVTNRQTNTTASEQRLVRARVDTKIKVQVRTILVSTSETILGTKRVSIRWAEVSDLYDDAVAGVRQLVAAAVGLGGELPAGAAGAAGALAWSGAEFVLRDGRAVAGRARRVEAAGGRGGVAVARAVGVAGAVLCEGGFIGCGCADGAGQGEEEGGGVHFGRLVRD